MKLLTTLLLLLSSSLAQAASIPPAEEQAKSALEKSSRHGEYADVKVPGSAQAVRTWVVYPERKDKAPVVLVIHEIFGLSDWIRSVADQLAADGFIAVAPDLISGKGPGGGNTDSVASRDDVVKLVRELTPEEVKSRLDAVRDYALKLPAASGKSATVGFCWGGANSFAYATCNPAECSRLWAGAGALKRGYRAQCWGLYGEDDASRCDHRRNGAEMKKLGKIYEVEIYKGAAMVSARRSGATAPIKSPGPRWP